MAKVRTPREAWIEAALQALAAGGPDAIRVEALAAGLGVSKGGFYWHFADRKALLVEMLDFWEKAMVAGVIERVDNELPDPRGRLRHLFSLAPTADFAVELALRDWSRRDRDITRMLRRVDNRRTTWLRALFAELCDDPDEVDSRSMLAYSLLIGSYFIAAQYEGRSQREILTLSVEKLLA
jgi:AcrR family transcriptional regulator